MSDATAAITKTKRYACTGVCGTAASRVSSFRTGRVLASMWPSSRMSAIWVMKASRPERPSPQPCTRSTGLVRVTVSASSATISVRTIAKTIADGIQRSTTVLIGRIARASGAPVCFVVAGAFDMLHIVVCA